LPFVEVDLGTQGLLPAYVAGAEGAASRPAVVILQEIFGINANMRSVADNYAARDFVAIVPDLFWRQEKGLQLDPSVPEDRDRATTLMKGLDIELAVQDALAAVDYLRTDQHVSGGIAAVGYCLGGKLAYLLAMQPGVDAAVSYYGVGIHGALEQRHQLKHPLLLHIAAEDALCPPEAQAAIKNALSDIEGVTIMEHPRVGHAFARRGGQSFDASAAARADQATAAFLERTLKGRQ
jgi:carboxymethylenebutenolidase